MKSVDNRPSSSGQPFVLSITDLIKLPTPTSKQENEINFPRFSHFELRQFSHLGSLLKVAGLTYTKKCLSFIIKLIYGTLIFINCFLLREIILPFPLTNECLRCPVQTLPVPCFCFDFNGLSVRNSSPFCKAGCARQLLAQCTKAPSTLRAYPLNFHPLRVSVRRGATQQVQFYSIYYLNMPRSSSCNHLPERLNRSVFRQ